MIKFFRKIRQKLLAENKFSKYMIYAIGEIVLVVIGILIALSINNWNNSNIEQNLEREILNEILTNLDSDLQNINDNIKYNKRLSRHNQLVYEHLKNKTPITDSLKFYYATLFGGSNFQPVNVAFENLRSRGINIIKNSDLRNQISELYMIEFKSLGETMDRNLQPIHNLLLNQINNRLITKEPFVSAQPIDLIVLQNDIQFHETLKLTAYAWRVINSYLEKALEAINQTKTVIEEELNKK